MKIQTLTPLLRTSDIARTVRFYTDVLGFTCAAFEEAWGWATLERDGVELMLGVPKAHEPFDKPNFTGSFYFRVDDVDSLWERLKDKAEVCYPLASFDYGMREFAIRDNNGYLLQFGTPIVKD